MKRITTLALALVLAAGAAIAAGETKYGKDLTLTETTKISAILENPLEWNGKRVLVEGTIVGVCAKRGCWIRIASDKEFESLLFKVQDGVMVFPVEAKGKTVRAEGIVFAREYTAEELAALEKDHDKKKEGECDGCKAKSGKYVVRLSGEGAVIRDGAPAN